MINEVQLAINTINSKSQIAQIEKLIGKNAGERFVRITTTALRENSKLMDCNKNSILSATMECARLGLEPGGILGEAYFVPFKAACTLLPGYRGLLKLARQSGEIGAIQCDIVMKSEEQDFYFEKGTNSSLTHKFGWDSRQPNDNQSNVLGAYAVANMKSGYNEIVVMPAADINKIRNGSRGYKSGDRSCIWNLHWAEMAKKTVLRRLCKTLPLSSDALKLAMRDEYHDHGLMPGQEKPKRSIGSLLKEEPKTVPVEDVTEDQEKARVIATEKYEAACVEAGTLVQSTKGLSVLEIDALRVRTEKEAGGEQKR